MKAFSTIHSCAFNVKMPSTCYESGADLVFLRRLIVCFSFLSPPGCNNLFLLSYDSDFLSLFSLKNIDWLWNPIELVLMQDVRIDFRAMRDGQMWDSSQPATLIIPPWDLHLSPRSFFILRHVVYLTEGQSLSLSRLCTYPALISGESPCEREKLEARKGCKVEFEKSMKGPFSGGKENRRVGKLD